MHVDLRVGVLRLEVGVQLQRQVDDGVPLDQAERELQSAWRGEAWALGRTPGVILDAKIQLALRIEARRCISNSLLLPRERVSKLHATAGSC